MPPKRKATEELGGASKVLAVAPKRKRSVSQSLRSKLKSELRTKIKAQNINLRLQKKILTGLKRDLRSLVGRRNKSGLSRRINRLQVTSGETI